MSDFNRRHTSGSRGRSTLGYWVPLVITVGVATAGLAAWVWSERQNDDDDEALGYHDGNAPITMDPGVGDTISRGVTTGSDGASQAEDGSMMSRVQGAWRRTPSPKQLFDGASKTVVAGVAAAGTMFGGALSSIREESQGEYDDADYDHSQDHQQQQQQQQQQSRGVQDASRQLAPGAVPSDTAATIQSRQTLKRIKTVAIVVSSIMAASEFDEEVSSHASLLAHLPEYIEPETSRIFVLIHAPGATSSDATAVNPSLSITSSYSNIASEEAVGADATDTTPLTTLEPNPTPSNESQQLSPLYHALYTQAQALVDDETMIIPFSTPGGHVHILRNISPEVVYIQESLTGDTGEHVARFSEWVRQVVVVIGDEGGRGGLVDSDDESALADKGERWWQKEGVTALGKRITVVDGVRVGDDWKRRVCGHE